MRNIINYFLQAHPWQHCLMMVAPYIIYKFSGFGQNPLDWGFLVFYFLAVVLGWLYSIGMTANEKLEAPFQMYSGFFRLAIVTPVICFLIFLFMVILPLSRGEMTSPPRWAIFVNFAAIMAFAYSVWFAAKQFVTYERRQETTFVDYYVTFMALWFGFIGVWYLQPKIRTILANKK